MIEHRRLWLGIAGLSLAAAAGCHRVSYGAPAPRLDGIRFSAHTRLSGAHGDTISVVVHGTNEGTSSRAVRWEESCNGLGTRLRVFREGDSRNAAWDSRRWQASDGPAPGSPYWLQDICARGVLVSTHALLPGETALVGNFEISVRAILGDSLPSGAYRFVATTGIARSSDRFYPAGKLVLNAQPSIARRSSALKSEWVARNSIFVLVLDSLSDFRISRAFVHIGANRKQISSAMSYSDSTAAGGPTDARGAIAFPRPTQGADSIWVYALGYEPFSMRIEPTTESGLAVVAALRRAPRQRPF